MIRYSFLFDQDTRIDFSVEEDSDTSVEVGDVPVPTWIELERFRCSHCSLPVGSRKTCPAALSIKPVVEACSSRISYETIQVAAEIHGVRLEATMPAPRAIRSLIGLLLALSACPIMMKLRPMAHYHLPFGEKEHTTFRYMGTYLMAQYLRYIDGLAPDWELDGLRDLLKEIHMVNAKLAERIRAASEKDAMVNSLVFLDTLAQAVELKMEKEQEKLKALFWMFLQEPD